MISKSLEKITEADLEQLVQNSVAEGKSIEYKTELPGNADEEKKEFLADVSSFANAGGGDLLYGIEEQGGVAIKVSGVAVKDPDVEIGRLDSIIRTGIDPRSRFAIRLIALASEKVVVVIRVEQSWIGPHRVVFKGWDKFFGRHSTGKYPLDVSELRSAFALSSTVAERIQEFRRERIADLAAQITPIPFMEGSKLVLHLVPFESFGSVNEFAVLELRHSPEKLRPLTEGAGWSRQINLEGLISFSNLPEGVAASYVQFYRNGILEITDGFLVERVHEGEPRIPSGYEREVVKCLERYLPVLQELGVQPPVFVFMTLVGVKGFTVGADSPRYPGWERTPAINREILFLGEATIENFDQKVSDLMKPIFDQVWNASGVAESLNYDKDGNFLPEQA